jgi:hypothetical protein
MLAPVLVLLVAVLPASARSASPAPAFSAAVVLTPAGGFGGYEPAVTVDPRGGVWVAAHKGNAGDAASADPQTPYGVRGASWLWWSSDGRHFVDAAGGAFGPVPDGSQLIFADENAVASDDAGHVYAVDTNLTDATITRWSLGARAGSPPTFDFYRPVIPAGEAYDDRPWVAAHGNGVVLYMGNTWEQDAYPGSQPTSSGASIVHMSYDGGTTFDPVGVALAGSGWCRPAADHRTGSHIFYAVCTTNSSAVRLAGVDPSDQMLYSYVSTDDGRSWQRYPIRHYSQGNPNPSNWPSLAVGSDGTVYAAYVDQTTGAPSLWLFRSQNAGRTWQRQVVAWPDAGRGVPLYSVAAGPRGSVGLCVQDQQGVFAGLAHWGQPFAFGRVPTGSAQQTPYGDFTQCDITNNGKLGVTWTASRGTSDADVYYSQQK